MNMDPNFYRHAEDIEIEPSEIYEVEEHVQYSYQQEQLYTDEFGNIDLFDEKSQDDQALQDFIDYYPGVIREEDTLNEVLYKMNEQLDHLLRPIAKILQAEEFQRHYIDAHQKLPDMI